MIFPEHRESPDWAGEDDSREYRLRQQYQREAERQERERIQASNREKMDRLRNRIDAGEWQARDPAARAIGLGKRPRDLLDDLIDQMEDPVTQYDNAYRRARGLLPRGDASAALAWLAAHRTCHGGPA